ncbi:glutathione S-transferase family protein [Marinobacter pelagius]|uniref:glutathione S-transferase family protein n=1 Tax=Marinobacter sp. C7 TaxID=2951363 RepID=UPI001EF029D3|nr:glutathione S-transferase family protein [Marinobacter sp. C7]MCG7199851.1 glutathione S-transferase family protein [Marinobacter sp. C7]
MIEIHQFAPAWGMNISPFCLKVEIYCRLAGIPYQARSTLPFRGPRGKLPFIVDQSQRVPDSGNIVTYLKANYGDRLDGQLSDAQSAPGHMLRRLCEESLYFVIVYSRWIDDRYWPQTRDAFFNMVPSGARQPVAGMVRRAIRRGLTGQGYGRHPLAEVYAAGIADLAAIAWQLDKHSYAVGECVTSFDATLYAFLFNILRVPLETPLKQAASKHASIIAYLERMDELLKEKSA